MVNCGEPKKAVDATCLSILGGTKQMREKLVSLQPVYIISPTGRARIVVSQVAIKLIAVTFEKKNTFFSQNYLIIDYHSEQSLPYRSARKLAARGNHICKSYRKKFSKPFGQLWGATKSPRRRRVCQFSVAQNR